MIESVEEVQGSPVLAIDPCLRELSEVRLVVNVEAMDELRSRLFPLPSGAIVVDRAFSDFAETMQNKSMMDSIRQGLALSIAHALEHTERQGGDEDKPEGSRFITLSDTLAKRWAEEIRVLFNKGQ